MSDDSSSTLSERQQVGIWVGCIMGIVILALAGGAYFTYKHSDGGWREWKARMFHWHDPGILEMQNVHSDGFMRTGLSRRDRNRLPVSNNYGRRSQSSASPTAGQKVAAAASPYHDSKNKSNRNSNSSSLALLSPAKMKRLSSPSSVPSLTVTDDPHTTRGRHSLHDGFDDVELAFPAPVHSNSNTTLISNLPSEGVFILRDFSTRTQKRSNAGSDSRNHKVNVLPATPEAERTIRIVTPQGQGRMSGENGIEDRVMTAETLFVLGNEESEWADTTEVTSVCEFERDKVAERQRELFRRMKEKGYSTGEAQRVLTGGRTTPEVSVRA